MTETGHIRLSRQFAKHAFWQEERVYSRAEAWLDLIVEAAFAPRKKLVSGAMVEIPRGGIVASERFLSDRWKWSRTKVRAFLDLLRAEKMVSTTTEKTTCCTIIYLRNYERFNTAKEPPEEPRKDQRGTKREEGKEGDLDSPTAQTPNLEAVKSGAVNAGVTPDVAEIFFHECEKRPLSASGLWTDRDGNEIRKWQSAMKSFAMKWQANEAQKGQRYGNTPRPAAPGADEPW